MTADEFVSYIEQKVKPYSFRENGKAGLLNLFRKYPEDLLMNCVDIGISRYFEYDSEGQLTRDSVEVFMNKLGGIAFNKSRGPIEQEINHQKNKCKKKFSYWNNDKANEIFHNYISALNKAGFTEEQILNDLQTDINRVFNNSRNWTQWSDTIHRWIEEIHHWNDEDVITIKQDGTILPLVLFDNLSPNLKSLCEQVNASYENNLFDCSAVIMRRLLEGLLILSYQNMGIEPEITNKSSNRHVTLDKIIKNAEQNSTLALSGNTRNDLALFKDLGNYSAHKIWYNCTQQDISPHILKYRVIIEELIYKAGLK